MTTLLDLVGEVKPGFWSLRDRIKLLDESDDPAVADVAVSIIDDMYAQCSPERYMSLTLQTPVGYDVGKRICKLIERVPQNDPRRTEQALKLISYMQTPSYCPRLFPIDRESIETINLAISLLDPADPQRAEEVLAHIERIENDPQTPRAKANSMYWGNHGYMYASNRALGVAEAIKLLPEGSEVQMGLAIQHLRYLMDDCHNKIKEKGDAYFGIASERMVGLVQSMFALIPSEQHPVVIEAITEKQLGKTISWYESGERTPANTMDNLTTMLSLLPEGCLDQEDSSLLAVSMSFAQAAQERYPLMLAQDEHGRDRRSGWQLAALWRQIALKATGQDVVAERVTATPQQVTFHPQGRAFRFGEQQA